MPTVKGLSGSPILLVEGDNDRVVGIHTHKGYDHNEGLFIGDASVHMNKYESLIF
jgi:hypothetical protein